MYMDIIKGMGHNLEKLKYNTKSQVFQDNYGALQVDNYPRMNPDSKLIAVEYH